MAGVDLETWQEFHRGRMMAAPGFKRIVFRDCEVSAGVAVGSDQNTHQRAEGKEGKEERDHAANIR